MKIRLFQILFLITLLAAAVNSGIFQWLDALHIWDSQQVNRDTASEWEKHLTPLKNDLPTRGVIGYIFQNGTPPDFILDSMDDQEEYFLTQYTLAPLIVVRGTSPQWVIGNFSEKSPLSKIQDHQIIHSYGWGIYLMQEKQP